MAVEVTLAALERDPHPLLRDLRARSPVAWAPELGGWLVTSREACLRVMQDAATFTVDDPRFSTARVVGPSMLSVEGAEHERHRAPFSREFRLAAVRDLRPLVEATADRLLGTVAPAGAADLRAAFTAPLAAAVMAGVLGIGRPVDEVLGWYAAIVAAVDRAAPDGPVDPAGTAAFAELAAALTPSLGDRPGLSRAEAVSNAAVLLFGGIDTTDGMLANALWHLLREPDVLAAVRADPALLPAAIEESLRLEPAAARVDRYAARDVDLGGARIARGDLVIVSVSAANRDPAAFDQPDRFRLDRGGTPRHLAFAAGTHVCLGMHLARLEAHVALGMALDRLPGLALDAARPSAPGGLVFRKPPELRVRWRADAA